MALPCKRAALFRYGGDNLKKAVYRTICILELVLLAGSWAIAYLTRRYMGMARYVIYKSRKLAERYPLFSLKILTLIIAAALTLLVLYLFWKRHERSTKLAVGMQIGMLLLTALYFWFALHYNASTYRPYYFISPLLALAAYLQIANAFLVTVRL